MKASVITAVGDHDVIELQDVPRPDPGAHEVLVEVAASAVNHTDVWVRRGAEGDPPVISGIDVAGTIAAVGQSVPDLAIGDRVVLYWNTTACGECRYCAHGETTMCREYGGLGISEDGGHAEYVAVEHVNAIPLPDSVSFESAAAFPSNFGTAWRALLTRAALRAGEDVLVLGGSGGVGHAAVQFAKHAGARVITCTSSAAKAERLQALGADDVIDYTTEAFDERVRELTGGRGVDVVFDSVGGDVYADAIRSLDRGGRLVTVGATTGDADAAMLQHVFWKQLEVVGATGCTRGEFEDALALLADGAVEPVIDDVVSLSEIPDAHRRLESRDVFGKIVVTP
jgi:NADPH:quinone reductase-like Zn-dependent oxidoreductase